MGGLGRERGLVRLVGCRVARELLHSVCVSAGRGAGLWLSRW